MTSETPIFTVSVGLLVDPDTIIHEWDSWRRGITPAVLLEATQRMEQAEVTKSTDCASLETVRALDQLSRDSCQFQLQCFRHCCGCMPFCDMCRTMHGRDACDNCIETSKLERQLGTTATAWRYVCTNEQNSSDGHTVELISCRCSVCRAHVDLCILVEKMRKALDDNARDESNGSATAM